MFARAGTVRAVALLGHRDLRGWHYVLTGGILASLSPYGSDASMTGRWAYLSDSLADCAAALARLQLILDAAGAVPKSVALLPYCSSRPGRLPDRRTRGHRTRTELRPRDLWPCLP